MGVERYSYPLLAIIKYSLRKILFNRRWVIILLLALLVGVIMGYAATLDIDALDGGASLMDLLILSFLMPIISMIYGASLIRNEIEDRSITQVITAPLNRTISYLGYYISLAVSLSIIMLLMNLVGWLAFFMQKGIDAESVRILVIMSGVSVIGTLVYSALFLAIGVIFSKPVFFGLFYAFVWESFIGSIPGSIGKVTVKHFVRSLGAGWLEYGDIGAYDGTGVGVSLLVLGIIATAMMILGAILFRQKEFP